MGRLLCRSNAEKQGLLQIDSASQVVIGQTSDWVKRYVRLYFRPRTPTQYWIEGIRPKNKIYHGTAHCPLPIFFLFDSAEVLTRSDCEFSNGNLGSTPDLGSNASFLRELPWEKIYSTGWHDPNDHSFTFHRNAEVIVLNELDLKGLRQVVARTEAERETLISLLEGAAIRKWEDVISVDHGLDLFERKWTFIESVELSDETVLLNFSPDTQGPGPRSRPYPLHRQARPRRHRRQWSSSFHRHRLGSTRPGTSDRAIDTTAPPSTARLRRRRCSVPIHGTRTASTPIATALPVSRTPARMISFQYPGPDTGSPPQTRSVLANPADPW